MAAGGSYKITLGVVDQATTKLREINAKLNEANQPQRAYQREVDRNNKLLKEQRGEWLKTVNAWGDARGISAVSDKIGDTSKVAKAATSTMGGLRTAIGALAGGFTVYGITKLADEFARLGTNLKTVSAQTGVAAPVIQAVRGAGTLNGIAPEAMQSSLAGLGQKMQEAILDPSGTTGQFFRSRGIETSGVRQWQAGTPDQQMANVADIMKKMTEEKASGPSMVQALQTMGIDPSLLPMLQRGGAAYTKDVARANQLNPWTPEMAANADKLSRAFGEVKLKTEALENAFVNALSPAMVSVTNVVGGALDILMKTFQLQDLTQNEVANNPNLGRGLTEEQKQALPKGAKQDDWQRWKEKHLPWGNGDIGSWLLGGKTAGGAGDATRSAFLDTLAGPESRGSYNVKNGGQHFTDMSHFPEGVGAGGTSTAAGRYQFLSKSWATAAKANNLTDFSPASQDKAAWWLAQSEYHRIAGRDLEADLKAGGHEAQISGALKGIWPSLPGGSQSNQSQGTFNAALHKNLATGSPVALGTPAPVAPAAPPPSPASTLTVTIAGSVPNTTIGANAKGPVFGGPVKIDQTMPVGG